MIERLTDMCDSRVIPQLVEEMSMKMNEDKETWIVEKLYGLNIDKDILINQTQEIYRLNALLREYIDAEEQGLLLRLPCEIGSLVYEVYLLCGEVWEVSEHKICLEDIANIGKTVFLTREEAEQKLKEMEE